MRDDDLGVAFGSECSALKQRFLEPYALLVHILSGFNVIHCIDNKAQIGPKIVVKY